MVGALVGADVGAEVGALVGGGAMAVAVPVVMAKTTKMLVMRLEIFILRLCKVASYNCKIWSKTRTVCQIMRLRLPVPSQISLLQSLQCGFAG